MVIGNQIIIPFLNPIFWRLNFFSVILPYKAPRPARLIHAPFSTSNGCICVTSCCFIKTTPFIGFTTSYKSIAFQELAQHSFQKQCLIVPATLPLMGHDDAPRPEYRPVLQNLRFFCQEQCLFPGGSHLPLISRPAPISMASRPSSRALALRNIAPFFRKYRCHKICFWKQFRMLDLICISPLSSDHLL